MDEKTAKFRELLDQNHQWPDYYTFKFIVKAEDQDKVLALLEGHEIQLRPSEKGNYVSITSRLYVESTDEILEVYQIVSAIPGVMSI